MKAVIALVFATFSLTGCVGSESTSIDPTGDSGHIDPSDAASNGDVILSMTTPDGGQGASDAPQNDPDAAQGTSPEASLDGGAATSEASLDGGTTTPEAGYDGPICCTWGNEPPPYETVPIMCGGGTITRLCPNPGSSDTYSSGMSCMEESADGGIPLTTDGGVTPVSCVLGGHCFFNSGVAGYGHQGECHGTVVACAYSCQ